MNKFILSTALFSVLFAGGMETDAASWRINSNANRHAHFIDINAAMSSSDVVEGDTLYLDPGCTLTSTQNVTKRVTIIGTGYFLDGTTHLQATIDADIYLKAARTKIESVNVPQTIWLCSNDLTVERCRTSYIRWDATGQHAIVRQCYIKGRLWGYGVDDMRSAYLTLENCIIINTTSNHTVQSLYSPVIRHNYIRIEYNGSSGYCIYDVKSAIITDNILINRYKPNQLGNNRYEPFIWKNNIESSSGDAAGQLGTGDESVVFALQGQNDQRYELKDDSPAKGAATDGGDCGPSGGAYHYVPSGYPFGMPRFESSTVSNRPQDGQVSVSQRVTIQKQ